jgi:thiol-disulfide isomerase/thioredoxin
MAMPVVLFCVLMPVSSYLAPSGIGASASDTAQGAQRELQPAAGKIAQIFTLTDLGGARHELTQPDDGVLLVHFFATWCEPCREELSSLSRLLEQIGAIDRK